MSRNAILCGIVLVSSSTATALGQAGPSPSRGPGVVVEVEAGAHERRGTPVFVELPEALKGARAVRLTRIDGGRAIDAQVVAPPRGPTVVSWILRDPLPAGTARRYRLEPAEPDAFVKAAVACVDDGDHLRLTVGDRPVLQYNVAVVESPRGIAPYFRKSGHIHPLYTPSGRVVTDDFPPDHAHQHAVFFAWVNTTFEGRHLDFWNQSQQTGRVRHLETLETTGGPVFGQFRVKLRHDDLTAPGGPKPVLDETWTVRAYNLGDVFLVDLESRQECVADSPLVMNQYRYGGMGLRGNRDWFDPTVKGDSPPDPSKSGGSDFLTSEEKDRLTGNHTRPRWVDLSGRIGDRPDPCGVALLDHPGNFRFPQPIRIHPNKPYFCFAPMVVGPFEIAPGKPYVSRYRFAVHDGAPDAREIGRLWNDYAEPPRVRVIDGSTGAR